MSGCINYEDNTLPDVLEPFDLVASLVVLAFAISNVSILKGLSHLVHSLSTSGSLLFVFSIDNVEDEMKRLKISRARVKALCGWYIVKLL